MNLLFKKMLQMIAALTCMAAIGNAQAITISGNFGANGYDVINFNIGSAATIDIKYVGGYVDPTLSLFNASGNHLISNDDSNLHLYSHITQLLSAGSYSILVGYCCDAMYNPIVFSNSPLYSNTDGYNGNGSYMVGGDYTLTDIAAYMSDFADNAGAPYVIELTTVPLASVPEPVSMALLGAGLLGLGMSRRRRA